MRSRVQGRSFMRVSSAAGALLLTPAAAFAAGGLPPGVPDPCTLVTAAELQAIVGGLKGAPKPGDAGAGDISCEYASASGPRWIQHSPARRRPRRVEAPQWRGQPGRAAGSR